jgi:hypothetical protein
VYAVSGEIGLDIREVDVELVAPRRLRQEQGAPGEGMVELWRTPEVVRVVGIDESSESDLDRRVGCSGRRLGGRIGRSGLREDDRREECCGAKRQ